MISILIPLSVVFVDLQSPNYSSEFLKPRARSSSCQLFGSKQVHKNNEENDSSPLRPRSVSFQFYGVNEENSRDFPPEEQIKKYRKLSEGITNPSDSEADDLHATKLKEKEKQKREGENDP